MQQKSYRLLLISLGYLVFLRIIISISTGLTFFSMGLLFDMIFLVFWTMVLGFILRNLKLQKWVFAIMITLITIIVAVDAIYFGYYDRFTSVFNISALQSFKEVGTAAEYSIRIPSVIYYITPGFILAFVLVIKTKVMDKYSTKLLLISGLIFVLQFGLYVSWWFTEYDTKLEYYQSDEYLFDSMHDNAEYSVKYGYYHYHILDITRMNPKVDDFDTTEEADVFFEDNTHQTNAYSDIYQGYNLVSILAESLDTRFIDPVLSPNLYELYSNGIVYDNYFVPPFQVGATCNTEFVTITGLTAVTTNEWSNNMCDNYTENSFPYSMAFQLNDLGYNTYYFHSGYEWFYNRNLMIPQYGFETIAFQEDLYEAGYADYDAHMDSDMVTFIDEYVDLTEQFYIDMLTYSGHGAYNQPAFEIHREQLEAAYPGQTFHPELENYMLKLVELDNFVGLVIDRLEAAGVLDNTIITISPDHYAYMMDEAVYSAYVGAPTGDKEFYRQDFLIYNPNMVPQVREKTVSIVDVVPTILNLLDSSVEFKYYTGIDMFESGDNYVFFPDYSVTDGANYLYLDGTYKGEESQRAALEQALVEKIVLYEMQEGMYATDYFKKD